MHESIQARYAGDDDGRGELPDTLKIRVPVGFRASLRRAAQSEGVSASEFVREAVARLMAEQGNKAEQCSAG
jgi:hypothetical protein